MPTMCALPADLADMPPGPALGALLADLDPARLEGGDRVTVLQAWQRQEAHSRAKLYRWMVAVGSAAPAPEWADEIRAALTWTRRAANRRTDEALVLVTELPAVLRSLECGAIDLPRASVFVHHLAGLPSAQIAVLCDLVLPTAPRRTTSEISRRLRRLIMELDPEHFERRFRKAHTERAVWAWVGEDGTATVTAGGLAPESADAAVARIDRLARRIRRAGHPYTLGQIRADLFVGLLDGTLHGLDEPGIVAALLRDSRPMDHDEPAATGVPDRIHPDCAPSPAAANTTSGSAVSGCAPPDCAASGSAASGSAISDRAASGSAASGSAASGSTTSDSPPSGEPTSGVAAAQDATFGDRSSERQVSACPVTDSPVTDSPVSDSPVSDSPVSDSPVTDSPVSDSPVPSPSICDSSLSGPGSSVLGPRQGVHLQVSLATLFGLDDRPAVLPSLGPIPASRARRLVLAHLRAPWRYAVVGDDGRLVRSGALRSRPDGDGLGDLLGGGAVPRTDPAAPGLVDLVIDAELLRRLTSGRDEAPPDIPPAVTRVWRTVLAEVAQGRGRALDDAPGDRFPHTGLRRHVEFRDLTCTFPGCLAPAHTADLDHTVEHSRGGTTTADDLGPVCRHDHGLKDRGWSLCQPLPGHFRWRSPLGREYRTRADPLLPPLPPAEPHGPDPDLDHPAAVSNGPLVVWRPDPPPEPPRPPPVDLDEPPPI